MTEEQFDRSAGASAARDTSGSSQPPRAPAATGNSARVASLRTLLRYRLQRARELARVVNHEDGVNGVAFSPDGTQIATASTDKTARVWDIATGNELARVSHEGAVSAVAFSPDGTQIATASADKTARVWDIATGNELARVNHDRSVYGVAFRPDGTQIATASADKTARVWDIASGRQLARVNHHGWSTWLGEWRGV